MKEKTVRQMPTHLQKQKHQRYMSSLNSSKKTGKQGVIYLNPESK